MDLKVIKLNSVKGKTIKVFSHTVARLSFGSIREAEYDGDPCLVKWFSGEELVSTGCGMQLYENLKAHLLTDSPDESLLWPMDISNVKNNSFCYVVDRDISLYRALADMMEGPGNYKNCDAIVNAALCLTKAFMMIKQKAYYFLYMTEEDLFIHPLTGQVVIANVEFLRKKINSKNTEVSLQKPSDDLWGPRKVSRLFPPVCVRKERPPNERSDYYLLSVLLFEILYLSHPLEGRRAAEYPFMGEKENMEVYGSFPCFIYDREDDSNRPVRGIHINMYIRRNMYPFYIQDHFSRVFSQAALRKNLAFTSAHKWYELFRKLRGQLEYCPDCGRGYFKQPGQQTCRNCKKKLGDSYQKPVPLRWTDE